MSIIDALRKSYESDGHKQSVGGTMERAEYGKVERQIRTRKLSWI